MDRMPRGIDGHVGRDLRVFPDPHPSHIQDGQIIIGEKVLSHLDVAAVVAVKGRLYGQVLPVLSDDLADQLRLLLLLFRR